MTKQINWAQLLRSFNGLKTWIKVWIGVLIVVNTSAVLFADTPVGQWTLAGGLFVVVFNMPIAIFSGGLTRALAFPHLIWFVLLWLIAGRLFFGGDGAEISGGELIYGVIVMGINGISLCFDLLDIKKWLAGGREVLGLED